MGSRENKIIDELILSGAMEIAGIDSNTGEFLYQFTPKLKEVNPELYREHINTVNAELMTLWEKGFINIDFIEDSPLVTLTEKSFDKNALSTLTKDQMWGLEEIKRLMLSKEL